MVEKVLWREKRDSRVVQCSINLIRGSISSDPRRMVGADTRYKGAGCGRMRPRVKSKLQEGRLWIGSRAKLLQHSDQRAMILQGAPPRGVTAAVVELL